MTAHMHGQSGAAGDAAPTGIRRMDVQNLFAGGREVILVYKNAEYRLRLTSNDKLILTK